MRQLIGLLVILQVSSQAVAGATNVVSEPGMLPLLAIAAVGAVAAWARNRKK